MSEDAGRTVEVFRALAHPTRCRMLAEIAADEEVPRAALEEAIGLTADIASYHLKILVSADVVEMRRRGRNVFYALRRDTVAGVQDQLFAIARTSLHLVPVPVRRPGEEPEEGPGARLAGSGAGGR